MNRKIQSIRGESWCFRPQRAVKEKPWRGRVGEKEKEEEKGRLKGVGSRVGKERKGEEEEGSEQLPSQSR